MENVIVIGGGPAGLSAAIYNARAGLNPFVIAGSPPGGQLMLTCEVENYPGFESILGADLIQKMRNHAQKFGARIIDENVIKVDFSKRPFEVFLPPTGSTAKFVAKNLLSSPILTKSVLIATGAKALWLGLESETRLRGKGVSACATCDGFFFKGKTVAVVGGGDTAMEEALTLTKFAGKVYVIHRRAEFRASKIMQERVLKHPKIKVMWNSAVEDIVGNHKVEAVKLKTQSASWRTKLKTTSQILNLDGVFIAIGHKPDTEIFKPSDSEGKGQIELDQKGYIVTKQSMTSVPGVFAAGDCVDHLYRQAATAVGMGVAAALEIEKWLEIRS